MDVDDEVSPVVMPPLRVPVAVKVELKEELNPLESLEEIRREYVPTEWVASMVATHPGVELAVSAKLPV